MKQLTELRESIDYYARLLESKIKMLEPEEIDLMLSERDVIHDIFSSLTEIDQKQVADDIVLLDRELLSQIDSININDFNDSSAPLECWWRHLGELNKLNPVQKRTI